MRPQPADIAAPVLPPRLRWLNSVRALPYVIAWDRRYRDAGLATLGVHSPRFRFTGERATLAAGIERLGVTHPIADDSDYAVWHDYGCEGWPSLFLWGQGGALRWFHFGEGEYAATEAAIAEELVAVDRTYEPPPPLEPLRPTEAPGALVAPPSAEVFPGGSAGEPWRPGPGAEALELAYEAGGAHVTVAGEGELLVALDGDPARSLAVREPGLYDLAEHERHERHRLRLEPAPGLEVYSVSFSAGLP